jgi:hypothetical protein
MSEYSVGQRVWVYSSYRQRGPRSGTVVKVGRTLVTVEVDGHEEKFRMDTGRTNDRYGHSSIKTDAQRTDDERRAKAWERIKATRTLEPRLGGDRGLSADALERIADILEGETHGGTA